MLRIPIVADTIRLDSSDHITLFTDLKFYPLIPSSLISLQESELNHFTRTPYKREPQKTSTKTNRFSLDSKYIQSLIKKLSIFAFS